MKRSLALLALLAGCATGDIVDIPTAAASAPETRFDLFAGTTRHLVDSVRVAHDTLFANGIALHPATPRTPIAIPVLGIDSLRIAHTDRAGVAGALLPALFLLLFGIYLSQTMGGD